MKKNRIIVTFLLVISASISRAAETKEGVYLNTPVHYLPSSALQAPSRAIGDVPSVKGSQKTSSSNFTLVERAIQEFSLVKNNSMTGQATKQDALILYFATRQIIDNYQPASLSEYQSFLQLLNTFEKIEKLQ